MPYRQGSRLPGERASRLGHLDVLKSELVNNLLKSFEDPELPLSNVDAYWENIPGYDDPLPIVFGVDGSLQIIDSGPPPSKALGFVKTALLRLDQSSISKIDKNMPHPFALRDLLEGAALYHATVFPLRHIIVPGLTTYDAIRQVIFDSMKDDSLDGEPFETLKWIAFEMWDGKNKSLPAFECPHCEKTVATLPYDSDEGSCRNCNGKILLTDMLGFHQEMSEDSAPNSIATMYMTIHETLLLFTGIRHFWENNKQVLSRCLFVKDGPLSIRAQYSKLVAPIRRFLQFAADDGVPLHLIGQEKSGFFWEHLQLIGDAGKEKTIFIPTDKYIKESIQHRPDRGAAYGKDTNYGAKIFVKLNNFHKMVLNIPTGDFKKDPEFDDLIGASRILATLPLIMSNRYEGALLPIELAHGVASLSTYPSAQILRIFSEARGFP